ncbi:MAG: FHA domain-containing protein [Anaerolineae bacterium]|nr:FHA domain-containing protein [Anaerolineae bacterium]
MREHTPHLVDAAGRRFPLAGPSTTLGRSPNCDVHVPDKRASRRHAEVRWDGETCTLRDLGSANGTFLNGHRITTPQTLRDGDEIGIASATFTFRDPEATIRVAEFPLLVVDEASGEIWVNRNSVSLSPKEQTLFDLLYQNAGRACSKQEIAETAWPEYRAEVYDYQIESLVKRLREKLEPDPRNPVLIVTVRGRGYKLRQS